MLASPVTSGMFRLVRSMFGCGFILTGTHPAIAAFENVLCDHAKEVVNHATLVMDTVPMVTWNMAVACLKLPEFFETEEMGISMPKTCRGCWECSNSDLSGEGSGVGREEVGEFDEEKVRNQQKSGKKNRRRYSVTTPAR